jgi:hypothetical protein
VLTVGVDIPLAVAQDMNGEVDHQGFRWSNVLEVVGREPAPQASTQFVPSF